MGAGIGTDCRFWMDLQGIKPGLLLRTAAVGNLHLQLYCYPAIGSCKGSEA